MDKSKAERMMQIVIECAAKFSDLEKDASLPLNIRTAAIAAQGGMARLGREVLNALKEHQQ